MQPTIQQENTLNQRQFGQVYQRSYPMTVRFLLSLGARPDLAEEMAQCAWAKGWECRTQLRQPGMVSAWVNSIAKNMLRNRIRVDQRMEELTEASAAGSCPNYELDAGGILDRCDSAQSTLLSRYYLEGYTAEEIAEQTGMKPVTVRVRLMRMRRALRLQLDGGAAAVAVGQAA